MTVTEELEIKLYQLFKEDNWSDENAQAAVGVVKNMQKDANKDLVTKVDLADTKAALKVDIANLKVDLIKWMVGLALTAIGVLSAIVFGIVRFFA